ncbi:MAG TPA: hypothetical protein VFX60_15990 [Micromonospora sp.]|nr:hypothetical protein [Micromonospora sp.]
MDDPDPEHVDDPEPDHLPPLAPLRVRAWAMSVLAALIAVVAVSIILR